VTDELGFQIFQKTKKMEGEMGTWVFLAAMEVLEDIDDVGSTNCGAANDGGTATEQLPRSGG
jgi:hypothetical protein